MSATPPSITTDFDPFSFSVPFFRLIVLMFSLTQALLKVMSVARLVTTRKLVLNIFCSKWTSSRITSFWSGCVIAVDCRHVALIVMGRLAQTRGGQYSITRIRSSPVSRTALTVLFALSMPTETVTLKFFAFQCLIFRCSHCFLFEVARSLMQLYWAQYLSFIFRSFRRLCLWWSR